ncbi:MAG: NAD(P)H-binding protein [Mucispirillum sp.]|nr:NAD(P)H-binding protein [Mucispirillum sp.]
MKLAVICANGKAGKEIVKQGIAKGLDVTAFARGSNKSESKKFVNKDLFDLTADDLSGFDAAADAFGAWTPETLHQHETSLKHLCDILKGGKTRLLVVGGAGSLYLDKEGKKRLMDAPDFPEIFQPVAQATAKGLEYLRTRNDVLWTYITPAADFQPEGERTGKYILGGEEFIVNSKGESRISYADYAIAFIDEVINANHIGKRICVISE